MESINNPFPKTLEEYLQTRVYDQIKWYDQKSAANKKYFLRLKIAEIILSLCIPFLAAYINSPDSFLKIIAGLLAIIIAAITGIVTLMKFQENWIEYRTIAESLKSEKFLLLSNAGPYKNIDDAFPVFVERFESLVSNSTKRWISSATKKEK